MSIVIVTTHSISQPMLHHQNSSMSSTTSYVIFSFLFIGNVFHFVNKKNQILKKNIRTKMYLCEIHRSVQCNIVLKCVAHTNPPGGPPYSPTA